MRIHKFSVKNFRSFCEEQSITFDAEENTHSIFGANGAGKSNLYAAFLFVLKYIRQSTQYQGQGDVCEIFLLSSTSKDTPTSFEIIFEDGKYAYWYAFSLLRNKVIDEILRRRKTSEQSWGKKYVFSRATIRNGEYDEGGFTKELLGKTRDDALILTKAYEENVDIAKQVFSALAKFNLVGGDLQGLTAQYLLERPEKKSDVLGFLKAADLSIQDLEIAQITMPDEIFKSLPFKDDILANFDRVGTSVNTVHYEYDENGKAIGTKTFSLINHESNGTKKLFELAFPLLDTLQRGGSLYIDDFEVYLHPKEVTFVVDYFSNKKTNPNGAQLIINTHSSWLMDALGKRSVHLIGKDQREQTIIKELTGVRSTDQAIEKKYLSGLFGAVPSVKGVA